MSDTNDADYPKDFLYVSLSKSQEESFYSFKVQRTDPQKNTKS